MLVGTTKDMKLYNIERREDPRLINSAPSGGVLRCALAFPFGAATGGTYFPGIVLWDMVSCVQIRHIHSDLAFNFIYIKDNILAANIRINQGKEGVIYIHDLKELTKKRIRDEDLWTRKIDCRSQIATPCFGLTDTSVITATLPGEAGSWDGTTKITVWNFVE